MLLRVLYVPPDFTGRPWSTKDDAAFTGVPGQHVAVDLHVLRRCYQDVVVPKPDFSTGPIVADDVVADDRRKRDLVKDPGAAVAFGDVVLVEGVAAFDVTSQAGAAKRQHLRGRVSAYTRKADGGGHRQRA